MEATHRFKSADECEVHQEWDSSNCLAGVVKKLYRQRARRCCGEASIAICVRDY